MGGVAVTHSEDASQTKSRPAGALSSPQDPDVRQALGRIRYTSQRTLGIWIWNVQVNIPGPWRIQLAHLSRTGSLPQGGMKEAGFSVVAAQSQLALSGRRVSTDTTYAGRFPGFQV